MTGGANVLSMTKNELIAKALSQKLELDKKTYALDEKTLALARARAALSSARYRADTKKSDLRVAWRRAQATAKSKADTDVLAERDAAREMANVCMLELVCWRKWAKTRAANSDPAAVSSLNKANAALRKVNLITTAEPQAHAGAWRGAWPRASIADWAFAALTQRSLDLWCAAPPPFWPHYLIVL